VKELRAGSTVLLLLTLTAAAFFTIGRNISRRGDRAAAVRSTLTGGLMPEKRRAQPGSKKTAPRMVVPSAAGGDLVMAERYVLSEHVDESPLLSSSRFASEQGG
jgi:hypothetical protein